MINEVLTEVLEPQSYGGCEDAISREEALKVMCDKCPMYNCVTGCSSYRHIEKMPSVTPSYNSIKTELDCISREEAINELKLGYFNKDLQSAKDDPCIVDAMIDWAIRTIKNLPSVTPQPSEENILKFYYVESLDDYWIGERMETMYYAKWNFELQDFVWTYSKYLPWGERVVAPNTLWKEYTYPSEPKEIPFKEWIKGFLKKYGGRA